MQHRYCAVCNLLYSMLVELRPFVQRCVGVDRFAVSVWTGSNTEAQRAVTGLSFAVAFDANG